MTKLAFILTLCGQLVTVRFATPGAGAWQVFHSNDMHLWVVECSGYSKRTEHVCVTFPARTKGFVEVKFTRRLDNATE